MDNTFEQRLLAAARTALNFGDDTGRRLIVVVMDHYSEEDILRAIPRARDILRVLGKEDEHGEILGSLQDALGLSPGETETTRKREDLAIRLLCALGVAVPGYEPAVEGAPARAALEAAIGRLEHRMIHEGVRGIPSLPRRILY